METLQDAIKRVQEQHNENNEVPLANSGGISVADAITKVQNGETINPPAVQQVQPQSDNDTALHRALGEFGIDSPALEAILRFEANLGIGFWDTFARKWMNAPAFVSRGLGMVSEGLLGGQSMFTDAANWLNDKDAAYVKASEEARRGVTGGNPTFLDNIAHGAGTSIGHGIESLGLGHLALAKGAAASTANLIRFLTEGMTEAVTEAANTTSELYAEDKKRGNDAFWAGLGSLAANIPADMLSGYIGAKFSNWAGGKIFPDADDGIKWFARNFLVGLAREEAEELSQEPRQQAVEAAMKNMFKSGDMSIGNYLSNLATEGGHIFASHTDENGNNIDSYLWQVLPETAASTLLTSALLAPFEISGITPRQARQIYRDAHKADVDSQIAYHDKLKAQRDSLQAEIDTDITAGKDVQEKQNKLVELDNEINHAQEKIYGVNPITNPVQDDAGYNMFADSRGTNRTNNGQNADTTQNIPSSDTQQAQNTQGGQSSAENVRDTWRKVMQNLGFNLDDGMDFVYDENGNPVLGDDNKPLVRAVDTQADNQMQSTQTQQADTLLSDLGIAQNEDTDTETYNQEGGQSWFGKAKNWVTGLLGSNNSDNDTDTATQPVNKGTSNITYSDNNGKSHTLTITTVEFNDSHPNEKQFFGKYVEYSEDGNVVARYSPYTNILQIADNVRDIDSARSAIVNDMSKSGLSRLMDLGFVDDHYSLVDDGNEDFRHEYRTRQDTNPAGYVVHPDNANTQQARKREDTRGFLQRLKDNWQERKNYDQVRQEVQKSLHTQLENISLAQEFNAQGRELTKKEKTRIHRETEIISDMYSRVITARINAAAHLAGMSVSDYHKLWNLRVQTDINPFSNSKGFVEFKSAHTDNKNTFHQAETIIHLLQHGANTSTIPHEFAHIFLQDFKDLISSVGDLPSKVKKDWLYLTRWLGVSDIDPKLIAPSQDEATKKFIVREGITRTEEQQYRWQNAQEKFAVAFEQYYMTGKAPKSRLKRAFNHFKQWLASVYGAVQGITYAGTDGHMHEVEVSPQIKQIFDRMFDSVPYVPSSESAKARIDRANGIQQDEGFYRQSANEQDNETSLGRQSSIRDLLDIMHSDLGRKNSGRVWADYATVSRDEAKRISEATGLNINDSYVHTIIGSAVTHTLNRHGEGNEKLDAQLPITDADFERIPEIIRNPDEIRKGNEKATGGTNETIVYKKRINGHVLVVEEVRTGRKKLAFHTMRKSKAGYDYDLSNADHPVVKENAKSQVITSDNDPTPHVQFTHALSTAQSVQPDNANVNRIRRDNSSFVSQDYIERFNQLSMQGSGNIIRNNQFSLEFIGTGEGHQSYGWGLYFTQNLDVANYYRRTGIDNSNVRLSLNLSNGKSISGYSLSEARNLRNLSAKALGLPSGVTPKGLSEAVVELWHSYTSNPREWNFAQAKNDKIDELSALLENPSYKRQADTIRETIAALQNLQGFNVDDFKNGNIYFADIPEFDVLLDRDADLSQQPEKVLAAIRKIVSRLYDMGVDEEDLQRLEQSETGEDFYRNLEDALYPFVLEGSLPFKFNGKLVDRSDMAASLMLNQAGIPGLCYFDNGSRDEQSGTRNFVIWNTDMIKLLGISPDSDTEARQYFKDTARGKHSKRNGNSETYHQTASQLQNDSSKAHIDAHNLDWALRISRQQLDIVRRRYEGTSQWLKAPNDRDTNLTEKQWLQVRTPNFKHWFGDWERHPESSSKVVDENGEPLVVYHGSVEDFSAFDTGEVGSFFNSNEATAQTYSGKRIYATFINIRNPYIVDANGDYWQHIHLKDKKYKREFWKTDEIAKSVRKGRLGNKKHDGVIIRNVVDYGFGAEFIFNKDPSTGKPIPLSRDERKEKFIGDDFVVFPPNAIKSATDNNGMFSPADDIYKQTIGNEDNLSWSDTVDRFINGQISRSKDGNLLHVMDTPAVFTLVGMDSLPIEIHTSNMNKILFKKHHISPETLKQIPQALADPVMIFRSQHDLSKDRDSRVILTELHEKDAKGINRSIMAAITLGKSNLSKGYAINELTTVYRKDTSSKQQLTPEEDIYDWITRTFKDGSPMNLLLYVNKEKARQGAMSPGIKPLVFDILDKLPDSIPDEHALARLNSRGNSASDTKTIRIGRSNDTLVSQQDIERFEQLAYQGTGHIILNNKFGLEFIGSGEGNQAYGWGIYFAQNPKVAESYRRYGIPFERNGKIVITTNDGKSYTPVADDWKNLKVFWSGDPSFALEAVLDKVEFLVSSMYDDITLDDIKHFLRSDFLSELATAKKKSPSNYVKHVEAKLAALDTISSYSLKPDSNGNIYIADIPENDVLLDWDVSLDEQPEKVQKAMRKVIAKLEKWNVSPDTIENLKNSLDGGDFYSNLQNAVAPFVSKGRLKSKKHGTISRADMAASLLLNQAGVPGLRYWDGFSRDAKSGTHNFVIWNTDMIKLLGLSVDSDTEAKQYFRDTARTRSEANSESYHQIIGIDGARRLDEADGYPIRMFNLKVARNMERKGMPVKKIWLATGWMRGKDNQWRYEILDGKIIPHALQKLREISAELHDIGQKLEHDPDYYFSPDELQRLKFLQDFDATLPTIFQAPELFDAYPEARNIIVSFAGLGEATYATYDTRYNSIEISTSVKSLRKLRLSLIHEIQHAIQTYEDMNEGWSYNLESDAQFVKAKKRYSRILSSLDKDTAGRIQNIIDAENSGNIVRAFFMSASLDSKQYQAYKKASEAMKIMRERNNKLWERYFRSAGEVEARNAETRAYWNEKHRADTPLDKSEDVPRSQQIVGRLSRKSDSETYHQPLNRDVDLDTQIDVVRIKSTLDNVPFWQRMKAFDKDKRAEILDKFKDGAVINEHTGLTITLSKHGLNHILDTARDNDNLGGAVVYQAIPYLDSLAKNAYRVETHGDKKPSATKVEGQLGNLKQVHRFLVPVELEGDTHILKLTAKEFETGKAEINEVSLYDMKHAKKMSVHPSTNSPNLTGQATQTIGSPNTVSVRDMLDGVNDADGNPYSDSEQYNQFIGYGAAVRLDALNGDHELIDNLRIAQRMEKRLKPNWNSYTFERDYSSARKIWDATGWFRGADGQWKYELPYGHIISNAFHDIASSHISRNNDGSVSVSETGDIPLHSIFDAPQLFRAYDNLKNITVAFKNMPDNLGGYINSEKNNIAINSNFLKSAFTTEEVLIHEIQHWIQDVEGFAQGGNSRMGDAFKGTPAIADTFGLYFNPTFFRSKNFLMEANTILNSVSREQQQVFRSLWEAEKNIFTDSFNQDEYDNLQRRLSPKNALKFRIWAKLMHKSQPGFGWLHEARAYNYFGGEVEARNASKRSTMSNSRRISSFPLDTQDTASEEQFIFSNNHKAFSSNSEKDNDAINYFRNSVLQKLTGNPNETYHQIIGRNGAQLIDRAIGTDWLTGNLEIAQQMTARGFKPRTIKRATSWEIGHDGQWRFEVRDGSLKDNITLNATVPDFDVFEDVPFGSETQPFAKTTLGEILDAVDLFAAYPQLRDTPITFVQGEDFYNNGIQYPSGESRDDGAITLEGDFHFDGSHLFPNKNKNTILTLLHEIQHDIQRIEGFAGGSNFEAAINNSPKVKDYNRRIDALQERLDALYTFNPALSDEEIFMGKNVQSQEYYDLERKLDALMDERDSFIQNAIKNGEANNLYLRSAGETEARNVMTRHAFSDAQRRNTLLRDTEDFKHNELLDENGETYSQTANSQQLNANDLEKALEISRQQLENVRKQYEGTPHWMKAPNGHDTNLTQQQWLQVRTDNFKRWFGDWENDHDNASKIVDENGEPLVVYHGTPHPGFSAFNTGRLGSFFTSSREGAEIYTLHGKDNKYIYPVFLNIRNPYIHDAMGADWNSLGNYWIEFADGRIPSRIYTGEIFGNRQEAQEYIDDYLLRDEYGNLLDNEDENGNPIYNIGHDDYQGYETTNDIAYAVWNGDLGTGNHDGIIINEVADPDFPIDVYITRTPNAIKSATKNNGLFSNADEIYKQIGSSRKRDMDFALARSRPDMSQAQRQNAILEIEKLGESVRQGGNPKVEKIATHWLLKGHIILPEDNYKIIDAIKISEQQHIDPMRFDDPNTILAQYTIKETKASRRINPDNVPQFSNKVQYDNGIAVYTVEDTEEGQAAVRDIIDTHWGEDANPWCLAARDDEGSLDRAWDWWNNYDAVDKRIAFQNGKLLAFCASDENNDTWWDREDKAHSGIPYTVKKNGTVYEYVYNEYTWKSVKVKETMTDGTIKWFHENEQLSSELMPDGTRRSWHENGQMESERRPDGTIHEWAKNGHPTREHLPNGTTRLGFGNGQVYNETLPDGTSRTWYETNNIPSNLSKGDWFYGEQLKNEKLSDGTLHEWYKNGQLARETLPDSFIREWYDNGQQKSERLHNGSERIWLENGQLLREKLSDGTLREWRENGSLFREFLPDGTRREFYPNGQLRREKLPDNTVNEFFRNGQMESKTLPDRTRRTWDENGQLRSEHLPDGSERYWNKQGLLIREFLSDGTKREWYDNGQQKSEILPDGSRREWLENSQPRLEFLSDGTRREWYDNGQLRSETLPDGTYHHFERNDIASTTTNNNATSETYNQNINYFNAYKAQHPDGFINSDALERFNQLVTHATGNIIWNNRFDLRYVGSSEGGAAFGFGAYFEQNPDVAETYRRYGLPNYGLGVMNIAFKDGTTLQRHNVKDDFDAQASGNYEPDIYSYIIGDFRGDVMFRHATAYDFKKGKKKLRVLFNNGLRYYKNKSAYYKNLLRQLNQIKDVSFSNPLNGNVYQFDIPEDFELLDWDAALDEQPDSVKKSIRKLLNALSRRGFSKDEILSNPEGSGIFDDEHDAPTGGDLYKGIVSAFEHMDALGEDLFGLKKKGITRSDARASWLFNKYGIPGHRFLDGLSRNDPTEQRKTHNFVIWNMDRITMTGISDDSDELARKTFYNGGSQQLSIPFDNDSSTAQHFANALREKISSNNNETYHQIIGRNGAENLDRLKHNTFIMDNLNVAQAMNDAGKSTLDIRLATGWELAQDGEWRYEIQDAYIQLPNLQQAFQDYGETLPFSAKLGWIYDNQELFDAYPDLLTLPVSFVAHTDKGEAFYHHDNGYEYIAVSLIKNDIPTSSSPAYYSIDELRSILIHEIQHAVQVREGFAEGGASVEALVEGDTAMTIARKHLDALLTLTSDNVRKAAKSYSRGAYRNALRLTASFSNKEKLQWERIKSIFDAIRNGQYRFNPYSYMGGETEARNAQTRRDFSDEQRRNTPLYKTQDNHDWLIHRNGLQENFSVVRTFYRQHNFITPEQIERYEQLAYHGTDNTILGNRFDLRYAGSSTGGMAFGYGAYFAQNINVAQQYRHGGDTLKHGGKRVSITTKDGRIYQSTGPRTWNNRLNTFMQDAFDDLHEHATNSDSLDLEKLKKDILASYRRELKEHKSVLAELKRELKQNPHDDTSDKIKLRQHYINSTKEKINAIQSVTDISVLPPKKGNIYSFDIPDNEKLLDWDKSMSRQPEIVKKARREILLELKRWGLDGSEAKKAKTGEDFYMALVHIMRTQTADYFAYPQSGISDPKQKASLILNLHDVPGLRFLDGLSREGATPSKSHNFVIWNTDTLTMLGVEGNPEAEQHFRENLLHEEGETYRQFIGSKGIENLYRDEEGFTLGEGNPSFRSQQLLRAKRAGNSSSFLTPERYEQLMYHGTRNILLGNGFDLKYLSTGEGAQAYGYGIYLAQNPVVAQRYRKAGLPKDGIMFRDRKGNDFSDNDLRDNLITHINIGALFGIKPKLDVDAIINEIKSLATTPKADFKKARHDIIKKYADNIIHALQGKIHPSELRLISKSLYNTLGAYLPVEIYKTEIGNGNLYHVDGPENDVLLDWDAPMTAQPKKVLDALKRGGMYLNDNETGEKLYRRLQKQFGGGDNGEKLASQKLNELGIPGHRFWDAGSRDEKYGTHNFVIWNTDTLRILGLTDDSQQEAHDYYRTEDYYNTHLDSLDNDSDILDYSSRDYDYDMAHIDDVADAHLDALDNDGFNEQYHQVIGEYGTGFLNNSEEISRNLDIAKQMTAQGKNARTIRMATGWELGIDGKWKYEIMDGNILHHALNSNKDTFSLAEIFNNTELFSAYSNIYLPNGKKGIADIPVRFDDLGGKAYGFFFPHDFSISLERSLRDNPKKLRSILTHEIQHAIQRIEGFSVGGNETTGDTLRTKAEIWALRNEIIDTEIEHPELAKSKKLLDIVRQDNIDAGFDAPDNDLLNRAFYLYLHEDKNGEYQNAWQQWGKLGVTHNPNDYRTRDRLAGEVEARNVQARADFSREKRKNTLLADTEDTSRDEQIISETYKQARNADDFLTPEAKRQVDALKRKFQGTSQWLKAPNGKNTKLSELQWLLVRTDNFKRWFGDWEHDAANSSKVVDDNGEPLVVYHGTNHAGFSIFKGQNGHWFSRDRNAAETFINGSYSSDYDTVHPNDGKGTGIYSVFLNIRNPLIVDYQGYGALSDLSGNEQPAYYLENLDDFGDYDGVICTNIKDEGGYLGGYEELDENDNPIYEYDNSVFGVPSAGNIKSATDNNGDFSTTNNEIYKQSAADRDMDTRYFEALNAGDLDTARSIVDAQARAKGYSPDNEHRMQHKAPNSQDGYPNIANVMTSDFVPPNYWTHPQYYLQSTAEWEAHRSIVDAIKNNKPLTVYRAVPNDVKETALRNGDWVTPSRDYAVQHGQRSLDGKFRVIADNVSTQNLWWDGNSIAELGYDDGKNYAYRNTKNGRKLNDTVVRGNDGAVVPPSKRFNFRKSEEYYQAANLQRNPFVETYKQPQQLHTFDNPNAEQAYRKKRVQPQKTSLFHRIKQTMHELAHGFKGDFPLLAGKEGRAKGLTPAREYLRIMNRNSDAKTHMTLASLYDSLHGLNAEQLDIFSRLMLLNDVRNFAIQNPPARGQTTLFGYTSQSLKNEYNKFFALAKNDKAILNAIQAEHNNNKKARQDLIDLANSLGFNSLAKRLQANDFFLIQYADLFGEGDINTNYVIATAEMRSILLQDFERLTAVRKLKEKYDKSTELVHQFGKEWKLHIPKGYSTFNPLAGSFIQSAHSFTDNVMGAALDEMGQQLGLSDKTMDALRSKLAEPFDTQLLVLPNEIVQTLQKMNDTPQRNVFSKFAKALTSGWKKYVLYFPTRVWKYNFRNVTGDLDAALAGDPTCVRFLTQAIKELYTAYYGDPSKVSRELREFQARGGALTLQSAQELGDYKQFKQFNDLIADLDAKGKSAWENLPRNTWKLLDKFAWSGLQKLSDFREQWLRYAVYLDYLHQMQNNENRLPNNWGASVKEEVLAIDDIRDRAFKMANELLGAYDQVSEAGKQLRDIFFPFYSWIEVNAKRYVQLLKNGITEDVAGDFASRFLKGQIANIPYYTYKIGKTLLFINLFSLLIKLFNRFVFPDDENKLPPDVQDSPHITLGHDSKGNVLYFTQVGAVGDLLEWFGFEDFPYELRQIFNGQLTVTDWLKQISSAPFNKIINAINPFIKMPLELSSGYSFFSKSNIRDRMQYIAQSFGLNWPYKFLTGQPVNHWHEFRNLFIYSQDADEAAYYYTLSLVRQFRESVLGQKSQSFSSNKRTDALRRFRAAIRLNDRDKAIRALNEYYSKELGGTKQGLDTSMRNTHPLYGLSKDNQQRFIDWLSDDDKVFLERAENYHSKLMKNYDETSKYYNHPETSSKKKNSARQNTSEQQSRKNTQNSQPSNRQNKKKNSFDSLVERLGL